MTTRLDKPIRRVVELRGRLYVLELGPAALSFREHGRRASLELPWSDVLNLAERRAGESAHREQLRDRALKRMHAGARLVVVAIAIAGAAALSSCEQLTGVPPKGKPCFTDTSYWARLYTPMGRIGDSVWVHETIDACGGRR